jgi:hypothetical protein
MKIITKNPRDVVPNILEKDLEDKIFIVLTDIGHTTYLGFVEEISTGGMKYQTSVGNISGSIVWLGYYSSTLVELLIREFNISGVNNPMIIILESPEDLEYFLEDYDVTNNALIHKIKRASSVRW